MAGGPLILLSPHLDDAVLSAWTALTLPGETVVVNVCSGLPAAAIPPRWDLITGAGDARERMERRRAEDAEALALAGREALNLDFLDGQHRTDALDERALLAAVREAAPEPGALLAPAGIGGHADHVAVRGAALALAAEVGVSLELYADLPYATRFGWPAWVTGTDPVPYLEPDAGWAKWLDGLPALGRPFAERLDEAAAAAKLRAMEAYATQFPALNGGPLGLLSNPLVLGFEVRFPVPPG